MWIITITASIPYVYNSVYFTKHVHRHYHVLSSQGPHEVGYLISILWIRKFKPRDLETTLILLNLSGRGNGE